MYFNTLYPKGSVCGKPVQPRCQVLLQHTYRGQASAVLLGCLWALAGVQPPLPRWGGGTYSRTRQGGVVGVLSDWWGGVGETLQPAAEPQALNGRAGCLVQSWHGPVRSIGLEQVIKAGPHSGPQQIAFFGRFVDLLQCVGVWRMVAGQLEKSVFDTALLQQPRVNSREKPAGSHSRERAAVAPGNLWFTELCQSGTHWTLITLPCWTCNCSFDRRLEHFNHANVFWSFTLS